MWHWCCGALVGKVVGWHIRSLTCIPWLGAATPGRHPDISQGPDISRWRPGQHQPTSSPSDTSVLRTSLGMHGGGGCCVWVYQLTWCAVTVCLNAVKMCLGSEASCCCSCYGHRQITAHRIATQTQACHPPPVPWPRTGQGNSYTAAWPFGFPHQ